VNQVGRVEVVVPGGVSSKKVQEFIQQQQSWINKTRTYIQAQRHGLLDHDYPEKIYLAAVDQYWNVRYRSTTKSRYTEVLSVTKQHDLSLELSNPLDTTLLLSAWLNIKAKQTLIPWLDQVSQETGLNFCKLSIRAQKTRWGSCSARHNINLNRCLMFLEPPLVRYLMVHELCHTRYLNHSKKFWQLVEKFVPDYKECEVLLDRACYRLPSWSIAK